MCALLKSHLRLSAPCSQRCWHHHSNLHYHKRHNHFHHNLQHKIIKVNVNVESIQKVFTTVQNQILSLRDDEVEGLPDLLDWNELQQSRLSSHHGCSMPSNWQCTECMAWSWISRFVQIVWQALEFFQWQATKAVKKESRQEAVPLSAEEKVEDAPGECLVATLEKFKGKSPSLAIPQSMCPAVERRADQVRQRLRDTDPMSLRMAKFQSVIGRAEEQLLKKTAAAEEASATASKRSHAGTSWWRTCACFPRKWQTRAEASGRGLRGWMPLVDRNSSTGDYWDHLEPKESASSFRRW